MSSPVDDPCNEDCSSITAIACTLDADAMPGRLDDWRALLSHAVDRSRTDNGTRRVVFDDRIDIAQLACVVAAEQRCCAFFAFAITIDHRGVALEVDAPRDADEIVTALFGC